MEAFYQEVPDVDSGALLLRTLAEYDKFQFEKRVKGDYCNVGGLQEFDPEDDTDGPEGSWCEWHCPETDDDIQEYTRNKESGNA